MKDAGIGSYSQGKELRESDSSIRITRSMRFIGGWLSQPEKTPVEQIRARSLPSVGRGPRGGVLPFPRAPKARHLWDMRSTLEAKKLL